MSTSFARFVLEESTKKTIDALVEKQNVIIDSEFMHEVFRGINFKLAELIDTTKNPLKKWWAKKLLIEAEEMKKEYQSIPNS